MTNKPSYYGGNANATTAKHPSEQHENGGKASTSGGKASTYVTTAKHPSEQQDNGGKASTSDGKASAEHQLAKLAAR